MKQEAIMAAEKSEKAPAAPRRQFLLTAAGAVPALFALTACADLLPGQGPPPRLFVLSPKNTFPPDLPTVDWQLIVQVPTAAASLDTTRISLQRATHEYQYYAASNWTDRAPTLVQTLIVESFENSQRIVAVGRESIGLRADFVLKTELREFEASYLNSAPGGPPEVIVRVVAKLVQMPQRTIVGSQSFGAKIIAEQDAMDSIVNAFDEALGKVLKQLISWTLETGQEAELQSPSQRG
jgi:cholesterol transport system auxiliary component